jgi:WD40 repeat protein
MQDDCTIIFSETGTHKPIGQLAAPQTTDYDCSSIVFSPDGKTLASGARDAVILWDMETLQPIGQPLIGSVDSKVLSIAFSPDGKTLASGSNDNTVILWNLDPQIWIDKTCQHVTRNLTRAEWDQYIGDELPYQAVCPNLPIEALSTPVP